MTEAWAPAVRAGWAPAARAAWQFGRPHTLIGTSLSVVGLFVLAMAGAGGQAGAPLPTALLVAATWAASVGANVYIVGLNQISDLALDRINKPWLPLPSEALSASGAAQLVGGAAAIALGLGALLGPLLFVTLATSMAIGFAYSHRPFHFKRHAATAAASIGLVRGPVVNLGLFAHFSHALGAPPDPTAAAVLLAGFMAMFGVGIAVLKDVPDMEGDRWFGIRSVAVGRGPRAAYRLGVGVLGSAYIAASAASLVYIGGATGTAVALWHLIALVALLAMAHRVDPLADEMAGFYRGVWRLFYVEYIVVPAAVIAGAVL